MRQENWEASSFIYCLDLFNQSWLIVLISLLVLLSYIHICVLYLFWERFPYLYKLLVACCLILCIVLLFIYVAQSYQGFLCPHLPLSVAFLTAFGVDSDLAAHMRGLI